MEVLRFIFQSFWVWLGCVILGCSLITATFEGLATVIRAFTGKYKPAEKIVKAEADADKE